MVLPWPILNILFAVMSLAEELVEQTHVPVLMWSHHLYVIQIFLVEYSNGGYTNQ